MGFLLKCNIFASGKALTIKPIHLKFKGNLSIINSLSDKLLIDLEYKEIDKPVETASLHQVRGEIKKNTSDQWKSYGRYLSKLQEILISKKINF